MVFMVCVWDHFLTDYRYKRGICEQNPCNQWHELLKLLLLYKEKNWYILLLITRPMINFKNPAVVFQWSWDPARWVTKNQMNKQLPSAIKWDQKYHFHRHHFPVWIFQLPYTAALEFKSAPLQKIDWKVQNPENIWWSRLEKIRFSSAAEFRLQS